MGSKTRLGSYCTKRANNGVNLITSRNINTRLARPMLICCPYINNDEHQAGWYTKLHRHTTVLELMLGGRG